MGSTTMDVATLMWALLGGTILGLLAKWLGPGERAEIPLWLTILCGIGGMLAGNFLYTRFWSLGTPGVDWWRHAWQVAAAVVLVSYAARVTGRPSSRAARRRSC